MFQHKGKKDEQLRSLMKSHAADTSLLQVP